MKMRHELLDWINNIICGTAPLDAPLRGCSRMRYVVGDDLPVLHKDYADFQ